MGWSTTDVPGRDGDLGTLLDALAATSCGGRGQTIFLSGDEGSGRTALLHAVAAQARTLDPPPVVIAGGFRAGHFVAGNDDVPPTAKILKVVENVVSVAEVVVPYAALVGQMLSTGRSGLELINGLFEEGTRLSPSELVPSLLRELCAEGPVVCLVDHADEAPDGLWADLVLGMAGQVANEWPLVLVLALDGPRELGEHDDNEPTSLFVARSLCGDGLARWHPLEPVSIDGLARWTGPAAPDVLRQLLDVTGGRAAWAAQLWGHWRASAVVEQRLDRDPYWQFAGDGQARAADPAGDILGRRLRRVAGDDVRVLRLAREILVCAALEGRRFTADAVASALGRERDEVVDLLDDVLTQNEERPDGVVREDGSVEVDDERGRRTLWLYRFTADLDWLTLRRHHGLTDTSLRERAHALGCALDEQYGAEAHRVAHALARLFELAGDARAARHFRRMADAGTSRALILWRARAVLDAPDPQDRAGRRHVSQILIAAANEVFHSGPFTEGLRFAEAARRLAPMRQDQAEALRLMGCHLRALGQYDQARTALRRSIELCHELGDRRGVAGSSHELAMIDIGCGAFETAREALVRVIAIYRGLGDRRGEAGSRHLVAQLDFEQADYGRAHDEFTLVLKLSRELGDRQREAMARHMLGSVAAYQGNDDRARAELIRAVSLFRELGERLAESAVRLVLAELDVERGEYGRARDEIARTLALVCELGDRRGEAVTRRVLARVESREGHDDRARDELDRALTLTRQLGDRHGEAVVRDDLAAIDDRSREA